MEAVEAGAGEGDRDKAQYTTLMDGNLEDELEQPGFLTISVMSEIPGGNHLQASGAEHPAFSRLRSVRGGGGEGGRG